MAWRNVWRNSRRTTVTVAAMTLGLVVMILYAGLMEGYLKGMERSILDIEVGDLQVFAADYRDNPDLYTRIADPDTLLAPLDEAGFAATARLLAFGMAAGEESSAAVSFRGIDVERDARVSQIFEQVDRGRWLDPDDPRGVVIGRRLSRMLGAEPGNELVVLSQGADGSFAYDLYRVVGVLRGISDATDRTGIFMTAEAFRELLVVKSGVHQIIVRRPADIELDAAAGRVSDLAAELDVQTWRQLLPTIASLMDSVRGVQFVIFIIVYIAIAILILNAMLMAVFERVREFGVLKALGVGPFEVFRLILVESGIQTGLALAAGLVIGIPALLYLERVGINLEFLAGVAILGLTMDPVWRAAISEIVFAGPIGTLLAIVLLAVIYPALKAALISPLEAMRYR